MPFVRSCKGICGGCSSSCGALTGSTAEDEDAWGVLLSSEAGEVLESSCSLEYVLFESV